MTNKLNFWFDSDQTFTAGWAPRLPMIGECSKHKKKAGVVDSSQCDGFSHLLHKGKRSSGWKEPVTKAIEKIMAPSAPGSAGTG